MKHALTDDDLEVIANQLFEDLRGINNPEYYLFRLPYLLLMIMAEKEHVPQKADNLTIEFHRIKPFYLSPAKFRFRYLLENAAYQRHMSRDIHMVIKTLQWSNASIFRDEVFKEDSFDKTYRRHKKQDTFDKQALLAQEQEEEQVWSSIIKRLAPLAETDLSHSEKRLSLEACLWNLITKRWGLFSGKKGSIFTHPSEPGALLAKLLKPEIGDTVYDPACHTGDLLAACHQLQPFCELYGHDLSHDSVKLAYLSLMLNRVDPNNISPADSLNTINYFSEHYEQRFDVVLSIPPWGRRNWSHQKDPLHSSVFQEFGTPPQTNGDYAYILHMLSRMKPQTGRMAIIMPQGVLFRGRKEAEIRKTLIEKNMLDTIINLPPKLFTITQIPVVLMLFKQNKNDRDILFIDASSYCVTGRRINQLTSEHIETIYHLYQRRDGSHANCHLATCEEIRQNDYVLSPSRYLHTSKPSNDHDLESLNQRRLALLQETRKAADTVKACFKKLGIEAPDESHL